MKADLHVHTNISDSSMDIEDTIREAIKQGVTHLGIVNHDTQRGLKEAIELGKKLGVKIIPGVEISAYDYENKRSVHILGYNCDLDGCHVRNICNPILERRQQNSIWQMNQLIEHGYPIDPMNILNLSYNSQVIYKQHIMADLIEKKCTNKIYSDLYRRLFKNGGICDRDIVYADVFESIKAIKADGGIAILAHPGQSNTYSIIDELIQAGLDGIEINHEFHTQKDLEIIRGLNEKYNLILTGGSDFHGKYGSSSIRIGGITSPEEYLHLFDMDLNSKKEFNLYDADDLMLTFVEDIVRRAGIYLKESISYPFNLKLKNGNIGDLVTKYDREVEEFLINEIKTKYPDHSFITEEKTCENQCFTEYTWIIDPIDGTTNFVNLGKDFAISIALYINKSPYLGIVYDVTKDEMYSGITNKGAYLNGMRLKKSNHKPLLNDSLVDLSLNTVDSFREEKGISLWKLVKGIRGHRSYGVASLSICRIATGELNAYVSAKLYIWDYAAAIIILSEVGGSYTFYEEKEKEDQYSLIKVSFIASSNLSIQEEILENLTCLALNRNFTMS